MKDPKPINLQTDDYFRELGWPAVAKDDDGHVVSSCRRNWEEEFKSWLLECFDARLTVTNLTKEQEGERPMAVSPLFLNIAIEFHLCGNKAGANFSPVKWDSKPAQLIRGEMLNHDFLFKEGNNFIPTKKLHFWVGHILATPFPKSEFYIPLDPPSEKG